MTISIRAKSFRGAAYTDVNLHLDKFVSELCNFLPFRSLPPHRILNQVLERGVIDRGMSGGLSWRPFSLSVDEYSNLLSRSEIVTTDVPESVDSVFEWELWCYWRSHAVPIDEHRFLYRNHLDLVEASEVASRDGDVEESELLHLQSAKAYDELTSFLAKYSC